MRTISLALAFSALLVSTIQAQQRCPNGRCPVVRSVVQTKPVRTAVAHSISNLSIMPQEVVRIQTTRVSTPVSSGHWTYPGSPNPTYLASHLQSHHGQNVSGMSIEQQLSLHDSIHRSSRTTATTVRIVNSRRRVIRR